MQISISNIVKGTVIGSAFTAISRYFTRVTQAGAIYEKPLCVESGINSSPLLQQASMLILPSGYKGGTAYAELPSNGNGDLTWTRASDAWRTNADGLIQRVPWNLLTYSNTPTDSSWSKLGLGAGTAPVVTANAGTSPDGTTNASRVQFNCGGTTSSDRSILQKASIALISGANYAGSIYVKAYSSGEIGKQLRFILEGVTSQSIITLTDSWQRVAITGTSSTTSSNYIIETRGGTTTNTTADVLIYGAQLVEGSSAQTYFPTTDRLNVPRLSYMYGSCPALLLEPQRTNSIRNSTMVGAVTGVSGTNPTNWGALGTAGLTYEITSLGTENGVNYIDYKFSGTAAGSVVRVIFEGTAQIVASNGQTWTPSVYAKTISGTYDAAAIGLIQRNSVGGSLGLLTQGITLSSTLTRFATSQTVNQSLTAYVQPILDFYVTPSQSYNLTIRIAQPQMELGAYATTPILTTGSASATRIADSFTRSNIYTNGLITSSGGTWFVELRNNVAYTRDSSGALYIGTNSIDANSGNGLLLRNPGGSTRILIRKVISGVGTDLYQTLTDTIKVAIKWNGSTADVFVNGTKQVSATAFTTTNMEFLNLASIPIPYFIQQMALYPSPLSDTDCTTLTTL